MVRGLISTSVPAMSHAVAMQLARQEVYTNRVVLGMVSNPAHDEAEHEYDASLAAELMHDSA